MKYLSYSFDAGPKDFIEVNLNKQANVRVMDSRNYQNYRIGRKHRHYGGLAKQTPVHIKPPHQGHWYVVIDLGGYAGTVIASVKLLRGILHASALLGVIMSLSSFLTSQSDTD